MIEARGMEEVSIGDYVLSGGELPALVLLDAIVRLLPGVMGAADSAAEESLLAPTCWNTRTTPARPNGRAGACPTCCCPATTPRSPPGAAAEAERITRERRPDLWDAHISATRAAPVASPATAP